MLAYAGRGNFVVRRVRLAGMKPKFRMRAAVVETPRGPYFIKFTGPHATVTNGLKAFDTCS